MDDVFVKKKTETETKGVTNYYLHDYTWEQ